MTNATCDHYPMPYDVFKNLSEYIEYCEDCEAPMLISCCGDELNPNPGSHGGLCPSCQEHCL